MSRTDPLSNQYAPLPTPVASASWAAFCSTIVDRIEEIRATEAPCVCPACGSTTLETPRSQKWCPSCSRWRFRATEFGPNQSRGDGLQSACRMCRRAQQKARRSRKAIYALRRSA